MTERGPQPAGHSSAAFTAAALLFVVTQATSVNAQSPRLATDLVTHNRIEVARPAAAIWPYLLDLTEWKPTARLVHSAGPAGKVGEVFTVTDLSAPNDPPYFVQNVELVPNRRRTAKLYTRDGTLLGFIAWTLDESKGRTVVGYDVYSETLLPPERGKHVTAAKLAEMERKDHESNSTRFDAELVTLRKLVERSGRR